MVSIDGTNLGVSFNQGPDALEAGASQNLAFEKYTDDLYERMFANLRPDLKYKRVSVQTDWLGRNQEEVRQALIQKAMKRFSTEVVSIATPQLKCAG